MRLSSPRRSSWARKSRRSAYFMASCKGRRARILAAVDGAGRRPPQSPIRAKTTQDDPKCRETATVAVVSTPQRAVYAVLSAPAAGPAVGLAAMLIVVG